MQSVTMLRRRSSNDIMELDDDEKFYGLEDILSDIPTTDEDFGWDKDE